MNISPHISKGARYTIGARIETKLLDLLELGYTTYFSSRETKLIKISECIFQLDIIKYLIATAWEGKLITDKQCVEISKKLDEIGRMLGGWKGKLQKFEDKSRPNISGGK